MPEAEDHGAVTLYRLPIEIPALSGTLYLLSECLDHEQNGPQPLALLLISF